MFTIDHDQNAGEIVIHTPKGMILINECSVPNITRVVILPNKDGYVTTSDGSPAIMTIWGGVTVVEPPIDDDATEEMKPLFEEVDI